MLTCNCSAMLRYRTTLSSQWRSRALASVWAQNASPKLLIANQHECQDWRDLSARYSALDFHPPQDLVRWQEEDGLEAFRLKQEIWAEEEDDDLAEEEEELNSKIRHLSCEMERIQARIALARQLSQKERDLERREAEIRLREQDLQRQERVLAESRARRVELLDHR